MKFRSFLLILVDSSRVETYERADKAVLISFSGWEADRMRIRHAVAHCTYSKCTTVYYRVASKDTRYDPRCRDQRSQHAPTFDLQS